MKLDVADVEREEGWFRLTVLSGLRRKIRRRVATRSPPKQRYRLL
jgi:hypothetical protein